MGVDLDIQKIHKYIEIFSNYEKKYPGPVPNSVQLDFKKHNKHVVFSSLVHGDEVGALPAIIEMIRRHESNNLSFGGKVTFVLGHVPAALKCKRYLEQDLNRSFDSEMDVNSSYEIKRANELKLILQSCDLLFDFHQTKQPTLYPFYTFGFQYESYLWAKIAGGTQMFMTRPAKKKFSSMGMCIDEFVRQMEKPAVTLELSQRGFNKAAEKLAIHTILRVLKAMDKLSKNYISLKKLAHKNRELIFLLTSYKEPFSHPKKYLKDDFYNFAFVNKSECIGFDEDEKPIITPREGFLIFPKYPQRDENGNSIEKQSELYLLVKKSTSFFCQK